jgi:DNA helicase HerA-like ATPase
MVAAKSIPLFKQSESFDESYAGVYLGKTMTYKLPFFLDTDKLLNPHIVGIGMTGSGKTYFMKSYIIKFRFMVGGRVLVLDWNGEYNELVGFLDGKIIRVEDENLPEFDINSDVLSINLAKIKNDSKRVVMARKVVDYIIRFMHNMPIDDRQKRIFLIDEAWRALGKENNLGQLFREGRKYGFSMMASTQLVSDINNEILANAGAVFIFRMQNADDHSTLIDSGIVSGANRNVLSSLSIGNCIVRLAYKNQGQAPSEIVIRRIDGISTSVYVVKGGKMQIKVPNGRFSDITEDIIGNPETRGKLIAYIEANGRSVDLAGMMRFLAKNDVPRSDIVTYFRLLGFDDLTIVMEYESLKAAVIQ